MKTATTQLRTVTATETKAIKKELLSQGLKVRVQLEHGTGYIYAANGQFTADEKAVIRDTLVLLDDTFCSACAIHFTKPESVGSIFSGMPVRASV